MLGPMDAWCPLSKGKGKVISLHTATLSANQKSSPLFFMHCLGRTLTRRKLTEPTASAYTGNTASVLDDLV